jgi:hypothetical protein
MIVHVAVKVLGAVKPWAGTDKDAVGKPLRAIVTVRSATVWRGFKITVRTSGRYADTDADLGLCSGSTYCNAKSSDGGQRKKFHSAHKFTSPKFRERSRLRSCAANRRRCRVSAQKGCLIGKEKIEVKVLSANEDLP